MELEETKVSVSSSSLSTPAPPQPPSLLNQPLSPDEVLTRSLLGTFFFFLTRRFFLSTSKGGGGKSCPIFISRRGVLFSQILSTTCHFPSFFHLNSWPEGCVLGEAKEEETCCFKEARGIWCLRKGKWMVESSGSGFWGRVEGSFERQDCMVEATALQIRSFRPLAILVSALLFFLSFSVCVE